MRASENGYDDIVRTLLQADADINAQNNVMMMMMIVIDVFMLKIVNYDDSKLKLIILIMMI